MQEGIVFNSVLIKAAFGSAYGRRRPPHHLSMISPFFNSGSACPAKNIIHLNNSSSVARKQIGVLVFCGFFCVTLPS